MTNQQLTAQAVDRYADMVWRLALARTGNVSDAEDVFQEVFLRHLRHGHKLTSPEHEKAWLIRCTIQRSASLLTTARISAVMNTVTPAAMPRHTRTLRRILSYRCAPKFWPANVVIDTPNALIIIQYRPSILPYAVQAAITSVPKPLTLA